MRVTPTLQLSEALHTVQPLSSTPTTLFRYQRAVIGNETFYSKSYTRVKQRNSYTVQYRYVDTTTTTTSIGVGQIDFFISTPDAAASQPHLFAVVTPLSRTSHQQFTTGEHVHKTLNKCIIPVEAVSASGESTLVCVNVTEIICKCVFMSFTHSTAAAAEHMYIATFPNRLHID